MFENPEVTAAAIIGGCTVFASLVAATAAALIGRKFQNQKQLKADLLDALSDIEFLLAVEREHGEIHRKQTGQPKTQIVRAKVEQNSGLIWSQRFSPGRAKYLKTTNKR